NPLLGRWVSADPLAIHAPGQADLNVYAYVSGSILKNVDPLGLDKLNTDEAAESTDADGNREVEFGVDTIEQDRSMDNSYNGPSAEQAESAAPTSHDVDKALDKVRYENPELELGLGLLDSAIDL